MQSLQTCPSQCCEYAVDAADVRFTKPTDNALIQAFIGRLRAECLNAHWFMTLGPEGAPANIADAPELGKGMW